MYPQVRQKKMSERLSEWLDHYNEVSHRQQQYLQRIHDLRRGILNKDEKNIMYTIEKMRNNEKARTRRKFPLYTMCRMENSPVNQGPAAFPNRQSFFHADDKKISPRARLEVHNTPRKLAPIVNKVKVNRSIDMSKLIKVDNAEDVYASDRPDLAKMKTEYESFESIAKRNKLNLTQFFNSTLSHRRSGQRLPMSVSTVTIIDETTERSPVSQRDSPVELITDISGKKALSLHIKGKDKHSVNASLVSQTT